MEHYKPFMCTKCKKKTLVETVQDIVCSNCGLCYEKPLETTKKHFYEQCALTPTGKKRKHKTISQKITPDVACQRLDTHIRKLGIVADEDVLKIISNACLDNVEEDMKRMPWKLVVSIIFTKNWKSQTSKNIIKKRRTFLKNVIKSYNSRILEYIGRPHTRFVKIGSLPYKRVKKDPKNICPCRPIRYTKVERDTLAHKSLVKCKQLYKKVIKKRNWKSLYNTPTMRKIHERVIFEDFYTRNIQACENFLYTDGEIVEENRIELGKKVAVRKNLGSRGQCYLP